MTSHRTMHAGWLLPFAANPAAMITFWWLSRAGLLAVPYWALVVLLVVCGSLNAIVLLATRACGRRVRVVLRSAVAATFTTAVTYTMGWGPMVAIGYALGVADVIHAETGEGWWIPAVWMALGRVVEVTLTRLDDDTVIANIHDLTQCRALEDALRRQAHTDMLTGLANRAAITARLEETAELQQRAASIMYIDLDGFKQVNDQQGHERGDAEGITASIGIACSQRCEAADHLLHRADQAMYAAKENGRARCRLAA